MLNAKETYQIPKADKESKLLNRACRKANEKNGFLPLKIAKAHVIVKKGVETGKKRPLIENEKILPKTAFTQATLPFK